MIIIDKAELVGHIAMWLYRLAPKHRPRKVDSIIDDVIKYVDDTFTAPLKSDPEFRTHDFENRDSLYSYIDTMMKSIKEFRELNLTWREYISGIDVDSPDRESVIVFTSRYKVESADAWFEEDFVDLDAFVQDVTYTLLEEQAEE
jgi:hypothetical protein